MLNKKSLLFFVVILNIVIFIFSAINVLADGDDESATFNSLAPDAMIVLDLSGSMADNPTGTSYPYGNSTSCVADTTHCTGHSSNCSGGFCNASYNNCNVDCSKLAIAKRAIFNILDDNNDNIIDVNDSKSLNIRIGFYRFYNCSSDVTVTTGSTYNSGCATLVRGLGTTYSQIYCNNTTSCASTVTGCSPSGECVVGESATGGTPLATTLREVKVYLDYNKSQDSAKSCRQKFVILLTDGSDTYGCSGDGGECQSYMYERRQAVVAATKQLADAGYKVFVVGFGSTMPVYLQNTLNWMSYYGGTDNPLADNSGSTAQYNIATGCMANPAVPSACCNLSTNPTACFPTGVTSCHTSTDATSSDCGSSTSHFKATTNDPGYLPLSGYAYIAENGDQVTAALKAAFAAIRHSIYSFTQISVQAVRTLDENYCYSASFLPINYDPFWPGYLKRYSINADGSISGTVDWDAGTVLSGMSGSARSVWTYKAGALKAFNTTNLLPADFGLTSTQTTTRDMIVNYILNGETSADLTGWKLGDVFHSSPLSITTPNSLFYDQWDSSITKAFSTFLANHPRSSANGKRIIIVGDNNGQLHAIKLGPLSGTAGGGSEIWSFVPPNLISQLTYVAHNTHPSSLLHEYFVDGPSSAADVWLGTGSITAATNTGPSKSASDWYTYLVTSEGRGGSTTLWSSDTSCESNFNTLQSSTYVNYCGYYAFDITNTAATAPVLKWRLGGNSGFSSSDPTDRAHLGEPWSKMFIGRVRIGNNEKWVGLIGGGYSGIDCPATGVCDTRGKGFYVVDISNGSILWRYTHSGPTGTANGSMDYDLAAGPVGVDYDNDGFMDTAYIGDTGGNVWRFKFCKQRADGTCTSCILQTDGSCTDPVTVSDWSGGLLFSSPSTSLSTYSSVGVTTDQYKNLWVYFGTGDRTDPTAVNATQERLYAIKDSNRSSTYSISNLKDITSSTYCTEIGTGCTAVDTQSGWYIRLTGTGEKILSEPVVFQQSVYFTTFTPPNASDPCDQSGDAKLYVINYITGGGQFSNSGRSEMVGTGIPNAPVMSQNPYSNTNNIYISTSQSGIVVPTDPVNWPYPPNNLIYWRDLRLQSN